MTASSPPPASSREAAISSIACATIVFSTVLGSASDWLEPRARNSNLLPVNAKGEVRLRSPPCIGSGGSPRTPSPRNEVPVDRLHDGRSEEQELKVLVRGVAGLEQVHPRVGAHRPVVVLPRAVDARE